MTRTTWWMLAAVMSMGTCQTLAGSADQTLEWLVAGPFVLAEQSNYSRAYYKAALDAMPAAWMDEARADGEAVTPWGTARWHAVAGVGERPDFSVLGEHEHAVYLARRTWESPRAQAGELRVGSDDALRVWLNGTPVFSWYYGRGYTPEENVIPVTLRAGTNCAAFALVNGPETFDLGARLYSAEQPLQDGLALDVAAPLQTGAWAELNWYWMPAAGQQATPCMRVYSNAPACARVVVRHESGAVLTNISQPSWPVRLDLRAAAEGVYWIEARMDGAWQRRSFARLQALDATQEWWLHLLHHGHFFSAETLWRQMAAMRTTAEFVRAFSGSTVRAYRSRYTGRLEPYGISVPHDAHNQTALPVLVHLAYDSPTVGRESWSMAHLRPAPRYRTMIGVWPYCVGNTQQRGLGERDVLDVLDEVARLYAVDHSRVYLIGYSAGGSGCWRVAARHPDRFAALAPHVGYDCWGYLNLRNVGIWQRVGGLTAYGQVAHAIAHLRAQGGEARLSVDEGRIKPLHYGSVWHTLEPWLLAQQRPEAPRDVIYTTYGDVDGAYWVRGIVPERFGRPATVRAVVISNGALAVWHENAAGLRLDLRAPLFRAAPAWSVSINGAVITQAASGGEWHFSPQARSAHQSGLTKRNGLCGGVADVLYDRFVVAYTGPETGAGARLAQFLTNALCGTQAGQMDMEVAVVSDAALSDELCASNHVILAAAGAAEAGTFLGGHQAALPFVLQGETITLGGRTGREMLCVYPNPRAPGRYLLTVTGTNIAPKAWYALRCDVVLDGMSGSFDAAWREVEWDDTDEHAACGEGCAHGSHEGEDGEHAAGGARGVPWRRYGAGLVVVALGAAWWLSGREKAVKE